MKKNTTTGKTTLVEKDPENHMTKIAQHQLKETIKKELGREEVPADFLEDNLNVQTGPEVDSRVRTNETFRSREDIPKYLRMFEKGDNVLTSEMLELKEKYSGKHMQFLDQEKFAWNLIENEKIDMLNSVALPTATEMLFKKSIKVAKERKIEFMQSIEEMYGKQVTDSVKTGFVEADEDMEPDYFPDSHQLEPTSDLPKITGDK